MSKQVEAQMAELNARIEEGNRTIQELQSSKQRAQAENSDLTRQLEDAESRVSQLTKERQSLLSQLEEAKRALEDETRVSSNFDPFVRRQSLVQNESIYRRQFCCSSNKAISL